MSVIIKSLEKTLLDILSAIKTDSTDLSTLNTAIGDMLISSNGAICSIIQIDGCNRILSSDDYDQILIRLASKLNPTFSQRGHAIQFFFSRDLNDRVLEKRGNIQRETARHIGLDAEDIITQQEKHLSNYVYEENCYLILWSDKGLLDSNEIKLTNREANKHLEKIEMPAFSDGQNPLLASKYLIERHQTTLDSIQQTLSACEIKSGILNANQALRKIRAFMYPESADSWKPVTIENYEHPLRAPSASDDLDDASWFLPPKLNTQLISTELECGSASHDTTLTDPNTVRLGNRIFAPLAITLPADNYFNDLFNSLVRSQVEHNSVQRSMPFALSIIFESGSLAGASINALMATILQFAGFHNKNIRLATSYLSEASHETKILNMRISACTWAENTEKGVEMISLRKSKLQRALEMWGAQTTERTGRASVALAELAPALTNNWSVCPKLLAPLDEATKILPLSRPASPFRNPTTLFRSIDGKAMPYERFSPDQTTWVSLVSGRQGFGKSVLCNALNFDLTLSADTKELPFISIIDIGISSSGLSDLITDLLPANKKRLVNYCRLQNLARNSVNPLDTPLCLREPLPRNKSFMTSFITALVTPSERRGVAPERMSALVSRILDIAFSNLSDLNSKGQPKIYRSGQDTILDAAVKTLDISPDVEPSYWQLTDAFFEKGDFGMAMRAQYLAMPTLDNLAGIANSTELKEEYKAILSDGTSLIDLFSTGIREAVSEYPIFSHPTRFDIGATRIMIFDLQDVAAKGNSSDFKRTSLMYMIARECFIKKISFSAETLPSIPTKYRRYYSMLIKQLTDVKKVLFIDEYHKTDDNPIFRDQIMTDAREARKWFLEIMIASQLHSDFGDLYKVASSHFILDAGVKATQDWLKEKLGLTPAELIALRANAQGAKAEGTTMLGVFDTKNHKITQLLTFTIAPLLLWSLSTSAQDRRLRSILIENLGAPTARKLLAARFPNGSCTSYISAKAEAGEDHQRFEGDDDNLTLVEALADEMISDARKAQLFA